MHYYFRETQSHSNNVRKIRQRQFDETSGILNYLESGNSCSCWNIFIKLCDMMMYIIIGRNATRIQQRLQKHCRSENAIRNIREKKTCETMSQWRLTPVTDAVCLLSEDLLLPKKYLKLLQPVRRNTFLTSIIRQFLNCSTQKITNTSNTHRYFQKQNSKIKSNLTLSFKKYIRQDFHKVQRIFLLLNFPLKRIVSQRNCYYYCYYNFANDNCRT